ncbi:hypothetical protein P5P86_18380 [Nocardioides sp. BP30]|uniref:nucleoside-diphosphate sugar epimerase/dehydratase n=1 Tax=Nocardioides sp. BP30 TaxID=3036374 RepID=UPI0024688231|nr:hypothetical protein [Nocardioides sp. BP30]WGL51907.1 hypothetical protein P5P86_18380 [Nocardioides sp. BP30]
MTTQEAVDRLIRIHLLDAATVLLFGHSNATAAIQHRLGEAGIEVSAYLDNNPMKQGSSFDGVPVFGPELITTLTGGRTVVLISSPHFGVMRDQLRALGFEGEIVRILGREAQVSLPSTEEEHVVKARASYGASLLRDIRTRFAKHHLVLCPFDGLGDVYWLMSYLPAFCAENRIGQAAAVVAGRGSEQVVRTAGVDVAAVLTPQEMDDLIRAVLLDGDDRYTIGFTPDRSGSPLIFQGESLTLFDYYRSVVYGLEASVRPAVPAYLEEFDNTAGLRQGRSVIVAPYAKSVIAPPRSFWDGIVATHQAQGREVYTNVAGAEEPLPGTRPLRVPLAQMVAAVEHAGTFVGLRSGLCDLVHTAAARKIAVYPDAYFSTTSHKVADFFALPGWEEIIVPIG